jgi:nitrogen PTS system EIIA component
MKIFNYIDEKLIYFLESSSKEEALGSLVKGALAIKQLPDGKAFHTAILDREKIVSTGIGMGVAIPHAKLATLREFFIVIGILQKGVDWNALDGAPVRLIFLIGGPDDKQNEYLKILSSLTMALRDENLRKEMLSATTAEEVINLFEAI